MKRKRYSEEQIIAILKEHEAGIPANDVIPSTALPTAPFTAGSRSLATWRSRRRSVCEHLLAFNYVVTMTVVWLVVEVVGLAK